MPWIETEFKGKRIWAQLNEAGEMVVIGGRVPIRYSDSLGAKIYRAGASRVIRGGGSPIELPEGVSADATPAKARPSRGSGFGSAGTRTVAQAAAAKESAAKLLTSFRPDAAVCFTDGSCKGNPGPAGAGAVVKLPGGQVLERSMALGVATNNVGELAAVGLALDLLANEGMELSLRSGV